MTAPYKTNCTSDWSTTGYNIPNNISKYSLAVSKELLKPKMYNLILILAF